MVYVYMQSNLYLPLALSRVCRDCTLSQGALAHLPASVTTLTLQSDGGGVDPDLLSELPSTVQELAVM